MSTMVQDFREPIERLGAVVTDLEKRLLHSIDVVLDTNNLGRA